MNEQALINAILIVYIAITLAGIVAIIWIGAWCIREDGRAARRLARIKRDELVRRWKEGRR